MRGLIALVLGAGVVLAGQSFAKAPDVPQTADEPSSSSACHAYEQGPDGTWRQLPCQEQGLKPRTAPTISTRDMGKPADSGKATR
jgi:hypothetical protein